MQSKSVLTICNGFVQGAFSLSIKLHISSHRISKIELKHWQSRVKNIWLSQQLPYLIPFWSSSRMLPRAMENVNELTIYLRQIPIYKLCFSSTHFLLGRFYVFNLFPPPLLHTARPNWSRSISDAFVPIEESLQWVCKANGDPKPSHRWLKNGEPLMKEVMLPIHWLYINDVM